MLSLQHSWHPCHQVVHVHIFCLDFKADCPLYSKVHIPLANDRLFGRIAKQFWLMSWWCLSVIHIWLTFAFKFWYLFCNPAILSSAVSCCIWNTSTWHIFTIYCKSSFVRGVLISWFIHWVLICGVIYSWETCSYTWYTCKKPPTDMFAKFYIHDLIYLRMSRK